MKTLLILRHAKSSWDDASLDDHERPLNARGRRDAPRVGDLLRDEGLMPDLVITSDALRAHTTARLVAVAAGYGGDIVVDPMLYLANADDLIATLRMVPEGNAATVLIVGHNPGLEDLIERLAGERHDLPTAALAQLVMPIAAWSAIDSSTPATLLNVWRPKELL